MTYSIKSQREGAELFLQFYRFCYCKTQIVKSLNEVVGFKNKIEEFQRMIINQKAHELEAQLNEIAERIRVLDNEYSEKLKD